MHEYSASPSDHWFACRSLSKVNQLEVDGHVVGHIAFSPVTISDGTPNWYGLGPVSVLPEYQCQGIGKALIQEGLSRLKNLKAQGCCLVGHPDYYRKFCNPLPLRLCTQSSFIRV